MKLENKELAELVKAANLSVLNWRIFIATADDMDGLSEAEWVKREAEWIIEDYTEDGHALHEELAWARWLLKRTENGKRIPISIEDGFRPMRGFQPQDIKAARQVVQEYKAAKAFEKKIKRF